MKKVDANNCLEISELRNLKPDWKTDAKLINIIVELERLRATPLSGTTPPHIFSQMKVIFHHLESLGSSRIEGNRTTLSELVEKVTSDNFEKELKHDEQLQEIMNIQKAMNFIEESISKDGKITRSHLSQIHIFITKNLSPAQRVKGGEGSLTPGDFRKIPVIIKGTNYHPPDFTQVPNYIEELLTFANEEGVSPKDHLLRIALIHHLFACIHPFDNGNGRTVRVFTYALLIKYGFRVKEGRLLNPTAIFCMDREKYYEMLATADSGERDAILMWCTYVLEGLLSEIKKIDNLLNHSYLKEKILLPALSNVVERSLLTENEQTLLSYILHSENMTVKASNVREILNIKDSVKISRILKSCREKGLLQPLKKNGRIYTIRFINKYLLQGVITSLEKHGFTPGLNG